MRKQLMALTIIIILAFFTIAIAKEKRTVVPSDVHKEIKTINKTTDNIVPSGRWKWSSRWQIGSISRWNIYNLNKDTAGRWVMPWSENNRYSNITYRGFYGSKVPAVPREIYRYKSFRPHHYFGRFRSYKHYYPFGHFYFHLYPRYFISFWGYPFWAWHWYPSWWIYYDCYYHPSYYYYDYWYPRAYYYRPDNPYENKYYARIITDIEPSETMIYVDGTFIGEAKDFYGWWIAHPLKAGKHQIVLKLPGYKTYSVSIELAPKQVYELKYKMVKLDNNSDSTKDSYNYDNLAKGSLNLQVQPSDAAIYINNEYIGTVDEILKENNKLMLPAGIYKITIIKPNYIPYHTEIEIKENEENNLTVELVKRQLV
jgi:hypothetical protein